MLLSLLSVQGEPLCSYCPMLFVPCHQRGYVLTPVCWLVCLCAGLHNNCWMDSSASWLEGSGPRKNPITSGVTMATGVDLGITSVSTVRWLEVPFFECLTLANWYRHSFTYRIYQKVNRLKHQQREVRDRRQVMAHSLFITEKNVAFFIGITMFNTDGPFSQVTVTATLTWVPWCKTSTTTNSDLHM